MNIVKKLKNIREKKKICDNVFNYAPIIIFISDLQGKIIDCNKYAIKLIGFGYEEIIGTSWINKFIPEVEKKAMGQILKSHKEGRLVANFESKLIKKNGQQISILWKNRFLYNKDRSMKAVLSMGIDISLQKNNEKKLQQMDYYNHLTKLPNRIWLQEKANRIIVESDSKEKMALVFLDIDNMKYVNDTVGYSNGDKLLQYTSKMIKRQVKEPNMVVHMSGDEFVVLFRNISDTRDVTSRVEDLQKKLNKIYVIGKHQIFISASIGVAMYPNHGNELDTLLKNAETAMYFSKEMKKGGYNFYSEIFGQKASEYTWVLNELRKAIKNEQFMLNYQPLIDLKTGAITGVEILIRWKHSVKGWISPAEFIPVAEVSGLIVDIGKWIFTKACNQKKIWNDKGFPDLKISINLSGRELSDEKLLWGIKDIIDSYNLEYSSIQVEITETAVMSDLNTSITILKKLKELGIRIALDDFGTGYSSLNYLKVLPIDVIKLDGSFIKSIQDPNQQEDILSTVIQLGRILNLEIVAEGIETKEQATFLRNQNCDLGQGYLFSKPLTAEEIESLLKSNVKFI